MYLAISETRQRLLEEFQPFLSEFYALVDVKRDDFEDACELMESKWDIEIYWREETFSFWFRQNKNDLPVRLWGAPTDIFEYENQGCYTEGNSILLYLNLNYSNDQILKRVESLLRNKREYSQDRSNKRFRELSIDSMIKAVNAYYMDPSVNLSDIVCDIDWNTKYSKEKLLKKIKEKIHYIEDVIDPKKNILDRANRKILDSMPRISNQTMHFRN